MISNPRWYRTKARSALTTSLCCALLITLGLLTACSQPRALPTYEISGGDADRGRQATVDYGCPACHTIPGITGADATVGPPLTGWGKRDSIAGKFPNTPDYLQAWIQHPQALVPGSIMPEMGVSEQDARDISAYLYSLQRNPAAPPWW